VISEERDGFIQLVGIEPANREQMVSPLVQLEGDALQPDRLPLPELEVAASDRGRWRALHKAFLTTMAGGREQLVGIDWGAVAVEPYQLVPLMRVVKSIRPRLLIADDTGLGKTAEAGIILRWLAQRHQANRVLIVTRAAPEPTRWQRELWVKFGFRFNILANGADFAERRRRSPTVNAFAQQPRLIVSMTLAARQLFLDELRRCPAPWDVVIIDEAHYMADRGSRTKRLTLLGRALAKSSANGALILLSATPHDGKTESFLSLLRLLDPLVEIGPNEIAIDIASRLVVRRLKSEVTLVGGKKFLQPEIHVVSTLGDASPQEKAVEKPLDEYLVWLAGEEARYQDEGARQKAKGCQFLAGVYRKRFGSSVAALRATLRRRLGDPPAPEDFDEETPFVDTEASDPEDEILDPGSGTESPPPSLSPGERRLARALLEAAQAVPAEGDSKLQAMIRLLRKELAGEKVVVFTEYRDTLRATARRLRSEGISFVTFHGDTPDAKREDAITGFIRNPSLAVFLATDAASEGKNLQRSAHHLVHLDVPWNPNRYVQRNGRIDRYGQRHVPHVWALVAADRRKKQGRPESRALQLVIEKLQLIQKELGSVGPVLPRFMDGTIQDVLLSAHANVEQEVDSILEDPGVGKVDQDLSRLAARNQRDIEQAEEYAVRFGTIDDFEEPVGSLLRVAFKAWDDGGLIETVDDGINRVRVPARLRKEMDRSTIERTTFQREVAVVDQDEERDQVPEFLQPAHPLVDATLRRLRDESADPHFPHRFDVEVGPPGLVLSFVIRFVDGEGRTVEERLEAVEIGIDGVVSRMPARDLGRLGIDAPSSGKRPDASKIPIWRSAFPRLAKIAIDEASVRADRRRGELVKIAQNLRDEEFEVLSVWRNQETAKVERLTLGTSPQLSFDAVSAYKARMTALDAEYEARKSAIRDRSDVRLAGTELIGGRLIVEEAE